MEKVIKKFLIGYSNNGYFTQQFAFFANSRKEAKKTFKSYIKQNYVYDYGNPTLKEEKWQNNNLKSTETIAELEREFEVIYGLYMTENGGVLEPIEFEKHDHDLQDVVIEYSNVPEILEIYQSESNFGGSGLLWSRKKEAYQEAYSQYSKRQLTAWIRSLSREEYNELATYYFPLFTGYDGKTNYVFATWEKNVTTGELELVARIGDMPSDRMIIDATDFDLPYKPARDVLEISEIITRDCKAAQIAKTFNQAAKTLVDYKWGFSE